MLLNQQLSELGYTTESVKGWKLYSKASLKDGTEVFRGTAHDVWTWLRETEQI